jgi:hypothetical protein|tara:strand:+ start:258 stop:557 length:300 start_codon:yes stop_codon:yes gene_type:complete
MASIVKAILAINPDALVSVDNNDIDKITWNEGTSVISKEDIQAKQAELQTAYDALEWKRNRQKEYPDAIECVHALLDGGDTLTDLQTKRTTIKEKYPKE